jgi:hypothetical protein
MNLWLLVWKDGKLHTYMLNNLYSIRSPVINLYINMNSVEAIIPIYNYYGNIFTADRCDVYILSRLCNDQQNLEVAQLLLVKFMASMS